MSSRADRAAPQPRPPQSPPPAHQADEGALIRLGPRDRLIGELYIEGDVKVNGTLEGVVEATGDIEIEDMAKVKASVAGRAVSIRGEVSGPVTARDRLVLARGGTLHGDVKVKRLVVQDGATFSGNVSMGAIAEAGPKVSAAGSAGAPVQAPAPVEAPGAQPAVQPARSSGDGRAAEKPKPKKR